MMKGPQYQRLILSLELIPQKHTTSWDEVRGGGDPCSAKMDLVWNKQGRIHLAFGTHTANMSLHEDSVQTG